MSLIANFPSVHAGRLFSVVGDDTKVVSSGIDQVSRNLFFFFCARETNANGENGIFLAENRHLGLLIWYGYQLHLVAYHLMGGDFPNASV